MRRIVSAFVFASLVAIIGSVIAEPFTLDCQLPFESIKKKQPVDDNCPAHGETPPPDPKTGKTPSEKQVKANSLQNEAKNNFCATSPSPTPALVTFKSFRRLQQTLDKNDAAKHWTRNSLPENRDILRNIYTTSENATIGEGSVVIFAAWLMKFKLGGGETCNCNSSSTNPPDEAIDRHLVLIRSRPTVPCCTQSKQNSKTSGCKAPELKNLE